MMMLRHSVMNMSKLVTENKREATTLFVWLPACVRSNDKTVRMWNPQSRDCVTVLGTPDTLAAEGALRQLTQK